MYRTPWLWQWGKLHLPISFYTRRICVLQGNIGRQCWGLFLLTSPEHAFVFVFFILLVFFLYMAHEDRTQYLMTMLTMFWFVFHLFLLLCFHPVSVDLTCSTEVSIAPWALSPSIPPSRSTDSEKNVQNLLVKFVCWSGFKKMSPHPTWPLMRRWKSAWDLGKTSIQKNVCFQALPEWGGGVYPCPNFWSIKRVYFFKNANVLNF